MSNARTERLDLWRALRWGLILALAASYCVQWVRMISSATARTGMDFIIFYSAGTLTQKFGASQAYDLGLQHSVEQQVVGFPLAAGQTLPYNHMPYELPLLGLVVNTDFAGSFVRWAGILLVIYAGANVLMVRGFFPPDEVQRAGIVLLVGAAMTFYPLFISLLMGQDTAFVYLGMVLWCLGILRKQDPLAGMGLALISVRPQICLMLAIPFVFRRRSVWWWFLLASGALAIFSFLLLGTHGTAELVNVLVVTAQGNWYGTHQEAMLNLLGLLLRSLPFVSEPALRAAAWAGYAGGILLVAALWLRGAQPPDRLLGLSILVALFLEPHLHYHDLALLLLPLFLLVRRAASAWPLERWMTLLVGASFLLFATSPLPWAYFSLPYLLSLALAWGLWRGQGNAGAPAAAP